MILRVGPPGNERLVGVRGDSSITVDAVHTRFARWVDTTAADDTPWAFDLILADGNNKSRGVRTVPQLGWGTTPIARARESSQILDALDTVLGGLDARLRSDATNGADDKDGTAEPPHSNSRARDVWLSYRAFTDGSGMVLLDAGRTTLLNDRTLERSGVTECSTWQLRIDTSVGPPRVEVPPALTASAGEWATFELAGIVSRREHGAEVATPGALLRHHATHHDKLAWFTALRGTSEYGGLVEGGTTAELRTAIHALLAHRR